MLEGIANVRPAVPLSHKLEVHKHPIWRPEDVRQHAPVLVRLFISEPKVDSFPCKTVLHVFGCLWAVRFHRPVWVYRFGGVNAYETISTT